jgi:hypothetical protein
LKLTDSSSHSLTIAVIITTGQTPGVASISLFGDPLSGARFVETITAATRSKAVSAALSSSGHSLASWTTVDMVVAEKAAAAQRAEQDILNANNGEASRVAVSSTRLSLSSLHSLQLARARARISFLSSPNIAATSVQAETKISPESANNVKQDDSGTLKGVGYNQALVRFAQDAMAPLAGQYLARHGVALDGMLQPADDSLADAGGSAPCGSAAGPGIGMLLPAKDFWAFRRERGFGLVS